MSLGRQKRLWIILGATLAGVALLVGVTSAPAKKKIRSPGTLTITSDTAKIDSVDSYQRLTVSCPGSLKPYGGGLLTSPPPGPDGQGVYPNSYERLGQLNGYHITATLINPGGGPVQSRNATLQVVCGKKIGQLTPPHAIANLNPGEGPKTVIAKCPGKRTLIGGGYQRTNGTTGGGVVATESRQISPKAWQVVARNLGGFPGQAVSIGYCVPSTKSLISTVTGSVTIPTRDSATATTTPCPAGSQLAFGGFSAPPTGEIRFMGAGITPEGTWAATGYNTGAPATLTAYGYCLRA
jgi:hypothetical protein